MLNSSNMAGFFTKSISQFIGSSYYKHSVPQQSPYILGTSPPDGSMELYILDNKVQVCSCPKENINEFCHAIIKIALLPDSRPNFFSITETKEEYTLILTEDDFKELPTHSQLQTSDQPWRVLTVSVGALGTFNEVVGVSKIAKSAIGPLADHNISVLCLSTYQSDYILIQESQLEDAIQCLGQHFKIFNEDHKRVNDAKVLSTSPASPLPRQTRPIIHPYFSPNDEYHVTGLDASKLSGVVQVLLELIFFSGSNQKDAFFHFTIVRGDISLVLNNNAFKKFPNNVLYTRQNDEKWRIISIGEGPLGFEECGIVAQVVEPLATSQLSTYYISTFVKEYCMVLEKDSKSVLDTFEKLKKENFETLVTTEPVEEQVKESHQNINDDDKTLNVTESEEQPEIRPGENMSLGESLQNIQGDPDRYHLTENTQYSRSPQTPVSECSSYGTSPQSDADIIPDQHASSSHGDTSPTEPIPIPGNTTCVRDSLSRLKC